MTTIRQRCVFALERWIPIPGLNLLNISMLARKPRGLRSRTIYLSRNNKPRYGILPLSGNPIRLLQSDLAVLHTAFNFLRKSVPDITLTESAIADERSGF